MIPAPRGLPSIEEVCRKHSGQKAFRLRVDYLPGPPPFPESEEETAWLGKRESLIVTVIATPALGIIFTTWGVASNESAERGELAVADLAGWIGEVEGQGAFTLASVPTLVYGPATIEIEHEAYEYHDQDPDSLDLEAWMPPRLCQAARGARAAEGAAVPDLVRSYARFVPASFLASSELGRLFR